MIDKITGGLNHMKWSLVGYRNLLYLVGLNYSSTLLEVYMTAYIKN